MRHITLGIVFTLATLSSHCASTKFASQTRSKSAAKNTGTPSGTPSGMPSGTPSGTPGGTPAGTPAGTPGGTTSGTPGGETTTDTTVNTGEDTDTKTITDTDTSTTTTVGLEVVKVGINFEDLFDRGSNDKDFNDAVLCFSGNFLVNGSTVTSLKDQSVIAQTSSHSSCKHTINVKITQASGAAPFTTSFPSTQGGTVPLTFHKGDVLEVGMTITTGNCSHTTVNMHNAAAALVKPDVCNTSGK